MKNLVLAGDLGGTNIRLASVAENGEIIALVKRPTPEGLAPDHLVTILNDMAAECSEASGRIGFRGIGLGVPANVTGDGILRRLPNIPTLDGFDLGGRLSAKMSIPAILENDATAAAIGESWLGASRGLTTSVMVTLGTGVGGGLIIDGRPLRGPDGAGGKVGHMCVEPGGHPCGCASNGCIEQYASAIALVRMAHEKGLGVGSAADLYAAFSEGDPIAREVFAEMGRYLGITLAGLVNTLNPEMIVIGGGVASGWDAFIEPLKESLNYRAFSEAAQRAVVVRSELGDSAGTLGAARCVWDHLSN